MQRRRFELGGSSALNWSLGFAVVAACNVYDSSLLTGGSEGQGGTSSAGEGSGGDSGTSAGGTSGDGGANTGGTGETSGKGGSSGSGTGGSKGGSAGSTGGTGKGGTDPTGGDAGEPPTGGTAGAGSGSGGSAGNAGDAGSSMTGGSSGSSGSGGSAGDAGSGGACGKCGCGKAETGDTDMDGVLDCNDTCPMLNDADCDVLRGGLVHRYSFDGTGTAVMDTKGTAHGTAMGVGAALSGSGTIVLRGGVSPQSSDPNKQYVDLPDNLLTGLTNATFEAWVTWTTATSWQRIFDFGNAATGTSGAYAFLTLRAGGTGSVCRMAISTAGSAAETTAGGAQVPGLIVTTAVRQHFVAIINDTGNTASLYLDGNLGSQVGFTGTIASLIGPNNWLGRSNYTTAADAYLNGTIHEFRIYNIALTSDQLGTSGTAGPDATLF